MNALDLYEFEINKPPTPTPTPAPSGNPSQEASSSQPASIPSAPEPTLNEEVTQALGSLGKFWGGFRKQSQSAFQLARKDFGQVVEQARTEINKIATEVAGSTTSADQDTSSIHSTATVTADDVPSSPADVKGKGKEKAADESPTHEPPTSPTSGSFSTNIFARLQSQLPPNLQPAAISSALQSSSTTIRNVDLNQIRSTLTSNIQRVQTNLNVAQAEKLAEDYLHKSTELFKEAAEFLQEAVKVVPPENTAVDEIPIVSGTDVWLFPSPIGTTGWGGSAASTKEAVGERSSESPKPSISSKERDGVFSTHLSRATRSEMLLRRLKYDPEMIRLDPSKDDAVSEDYGAFSREVEEKGGVSGETYVSQISEALAPGADGELNADAKALIDTRDALVPSELTNDVFWTRYFFRVQQIGREESKRKALLAGVSQGEDEFSWEDDEDEVPSKTFDATKSLPAIKAARADPSATNDPTPPTPSTPHAVVVPQVSTNTLNVIAPQSPRVSEDSYDLIDSTTSTRQQSPTARAETNSGPAVKPSKAVDDSDDSDWE